jgi:TonB family protein
VKITNQLSDVVNAKTEEVNDMHFRRLHLALAIIVLTALAVSAQVKPSATDWNEWETITPEGEEFTVSMPKNPTTEAAKFPYHKMELNTRLYLAKSPAGAVLAIASLSGIKSDPAAYSDFARFNSYIDAFKDFFPPKVRTKDTALTRLTLVTSRPFHGHTGRSYKLSIGELNGVAHAFATKKRFYVIVSLNTKKDDALEDKFLSSFVLPERQPDQPKVASQPNAEPTLDNTAQNETKLPDQPTNEGQSTGSEGNTEGANAANQDNNTKPQPNGKKGPVAGGVLNSKAIYFPQPEASGEATGVVVVQVLIDEQGSVIDAKAVAGPANLHAAAVNAARLARFSPTMLMGEPVKVTGTLNYSFARSN